jgi:hypothetical protein
MPTTRSHSAQVVSEPASQELLLANGQADCDKEVPGSLFVTRADRSELSEIHLRPSIEMKPGPSTRNRWNAIHPFCHRELTLRHRERSEAIS